MTQIWLEYMLQGELHCLWVYSWDRYFAETFSPECEILKVIVWAQRNRKGRRHWEVSEKDCYIAPNYQEIRRQFK